MGYKGCRNIFTCRDCAAKIVTLDVAEGLTLPTVPCMVTQGCKGRMESSAYQLPFNSPLRSSPIRFEWGLPERHQLDSDHARQGGLFLRAATHLLPGCYQDDHMVLVWMVSKGVLRRMDSGVFLVHLGFPLKEARAGESRSEFREIRVQTDASGILVVTPEMREAAENSDEFRVWYRGVTHR